ncbi:MAG: hypothetical protein AAB955_03700 [Patescibacteria group bacterium]
MDIEQLSKTQIILLVLLVTFVTSIATGIVTVSLLAQAPPAVTQTVNHVIQRTVEAVAPVTGEITTIKETTVVVKEDDLITSSIAASFAKVGRVHEGQSTSTPVVALGVLISGGILLSDSTLVSDAEHMVSFDNGAVLFETRNRFGAVGITVLQPKTGSAPAGFRIADMDSAKLGQSVIALPSASGSRVGIGAITARYNLARIIEDEDETVVRAVEASGQGALMGGAPLITAFGDVLGIATAVSKGESGGPGTFVALSDIAPLIFGVRGTSTPAVAP